MIRLRHQIQPILSFIFRLNLVIILYRILYIFRIDTEGKFTWNESTALQSMSFASYNRFIDYHMLRLHYKQPHVNSCSKVASIEITGDIMVKRINKYFGFHSFSIP